MTSAARSLLTALAARGVVIAATPAGNLKVSGLRETVVELTPRIREAKSELLLELNCRPADQQIADADAIEERAALAAECVPACYLDAWARFQCQRPVSIDLDAWLQAINDAGLFLDAWGADAGAMQWSAGQLFYVPRVGRPGGLVWQLGRERVNALGEHQARLANGRTIKRGA